MSAWLCSDKHFLFLAKAAEVHGLLGDMTFGEFAVDLKTENLRSLKARYGETVPDLVVVELVDISDVVGNIEHPDYVIKQIHCLDYQSCEHGAWETSYAHSVMVDLEKALESADVPAMASDDIPWGID